VKKLTLINVPSSAGARRVGQDRAPDSFREAGIIEHLRSGGFELTDVVDLEHIVFRADPDNSHQQNLSLVRDTCKKVAEKVSGAVKSRAKVIILGGDCTVTLGVLAGLVDYLPQLGLIYFDGDVDLNTPETTTSGIFDGMVMSHIIGRGADQLARIGSRYPLMDERNIVLFGYNSESGWIDPAELEQLRNSSMGRYSLTEVRGRVVEAATVALCRLEANGKLEAKVENILVHFDVDVIDSNDFPAADVLHEHGLSFDDAMAALSVFVGSPKFAGLVITEFNSDRDLDGSLARRLVKAISEIMGRAQASW